MFGKNTIYKQQQFNNKDYLSIKDIFYTIQGEGPFTGHPAVFVRTGYCNLQCDFCDTDFDTNIREMFVTEILRDIDKYNCKLVVITGGEPLLQSRILILIQSLLNNGYKVQIETSGSLYIDGLETVAMNKDLTIVCSPKTGQLNSNLEPLISCYKYVVASDNYDNSDGLPIKVSQGSSSRIKLAKPKNSKPVYLSPMDEYDKAKNLLNQRVVVEQCLKHNYILSLQVHKIIGVE